MEDELHNIRSKLDRHAWLCRRLNTCGACIHFSAKNYYGWNEPNTGKCFGWLEDDAERDPDKTANPRWVSSNDTCSRYQENVRLLLEYQEERSKTERALLAIKKSV